MIVSSPQNKTDNHLDIKYTAQLKMQQNKYIIQTPNTNSPSLVRLQQQMTTRAADRKNVVTN